MARPGSLARATLALALGLAVPHAAAQDAGASSAFNGIVDETVARARAAVEAAPRDPEALTALVSALAAAGRDDEALHWATVLGRESGDVQLVATWTGRLDPLRTERATLLREAAARRLQRARHAEERDWHLLALALGDGAHVLAEAAAGAGDAEAPPLAEQTHRLRGRIQGRGKAVERMAEHGVPVQMPTCTGLVWLWPESSPAQAHAALHAASGRISASQPPFVPVPVDDDAQVRTRHADVRCALGRGVARAVADLVEQLDDELAERLDDARTRGPLVVEVLADASEYASRRPGGSSAALSSAWQLAFLDTGGAGAGASGRSGAGSGNDSGSASRGGPRIVALDPRAVGEPFDRLWGLIAREICRDRLRRSEIPPPPWLERGLALGYEGVVIRMDGEFDTSRMPLHRLEQAIRSLKGRGPLRPSLTQVLELQPGGDAAADDLSAWCWALAHYLSHAEGDDGGRLWAGRLQRLLGDLAQGVELSPLDPRYGWRAPAPVEHFRQRILPADDPRGGIGDLRALEADLHRWLQHEAALRQGKAAALAAELEAVRRSEADDARRARRLQHVLVATPDDEAALALLVEVQLRRHQRDAALLAALRLAAVREPGADERFAELARLQSRLASELEDDDRDLREGVELLVGSYRAKGFPRTALAVLDAVLQAWPLDAGYRELRATLVHLFDLEDLVLRHAVPLEQAVGRAYGDRSLWLMDGDVLSVRLADRVQPDTLRGLVALQPPCEVTLTVTPLAHDGSGDGHDDGGRFAGLTLGAAGPEGHGEWGLFVTPAGRVELATRGLLEWPSDEIGRVLPGAVELQVLLRADDFEVRANDVSLGVRPYGPRPAAGWLGLHVRRAEASFQGLTVTHRRDAAASLPWYGRGRP